MSIVNPTNEMTKCCIVDTHLTTVKDTSIVIFFIFFLITLLIYLGTMYWLKNVIANKNKVHPSNNNIELVDLDLDVTNPGMGLDLTILDNISLEDENP